ncbi:MAG: tyrosine-protein kinase Etk/Wzc [Bacteroidia bacterium]|jgi:tyrosine-protein kinase Etk/Wzc
MEDSLRVLRPYLRGLPLIVIAMMIGLLSATKYLNYTTPIYESTAKIRLADVSEGVPSSNLFKDLDVCIIQ